MQLSDSTLDILRNFSSINQNILIKAGSPIKTISEARNVVARAEIPETFDSSLDHDGVENLLKILNTLGEDTNTFIISHKGDILDGKFESKIEFVKERNFSQMKI